MRFGASTCRIGRGIKKERGTMNRLESAYAQLLEQMRASGEVLWFKYECVSFELAKRTHIRPDFLVMNRHQELEIHEVKAKWSGELGPHIEDHANVKLKVFSEMYPFRVVLVWKDKTGWKNKEV